MKKCTNSKQLSPKCPMTSQKKEGDFGSRIAADTYCRHASAGSVSYNCYVISYDDGMEDAEWHDTEDLDLSGLECSAESGCNLDNNILSMATCLSNPWCEDI